MIHFMFWVCVFFRRNTHAISQFLQKAFPLNISFWQRKRLQRQTTSVLTQRHSWGGPQKSATALLGVWTHNAMHRWCRRELYPWNPCNCTNPCHPSKVNKIKNKNKYKDISHCSLLIVQVANLGHGKMELRQPDCSSSARKPGPDSRLLTEQPFCSWRRRSRNTMASFARISLKRVI